jgi:hypothetical protein
MSAEVSLFDPKHPCRLGNTIELVPQNDLFKGFVALNPTLVEALSATMASGKVIPRNGPLVALFAPHLKELRVVLVSLCFQGVTKFLKLVCNEFPSESFLGHHFTFDFFSTTNLCLQILHCRT